MGPFLSASKQEWGRETSPRRSAAPPAPASAYPSASRAHLDQGASWAVAPRASSRDGCIGSGLSESGAGLGPADPPTRRQRAAQVHVSVPAALPSGAPRTCRPRTATAAGGLAGRAGPAFGPARRMWGTRPPSRPPVVEPSRPCPAALGSTSSPPTRRSPCRGPDGGAELLTSRTGDRVCSL